MTSIFKEIKSVTKHRPPVDRQHERVVRMTQVIQSFASGFTLRPVKVKLVKGAQAPAFSSSNGIWFDELQIADLTTKQGVASLKGLTLHELSHILLTPRTGTDFRQWVLDESLHRAFNSLEDQRIESQLIALYPSIKDWLNAMISEYLLKHPEQWRLSFPLIHGRKYLDRKVRGIVRKAFQHQERVADLTRIIDTYRTLNFSDDADVETAKVLIAEYHELTKDLAMKNPNGHDGRSGSEQETNAQSRPLPKDKQREASNKVEQEEPEDDDDDSLYDDFDWSSMDDEPEQDEPSEGSDDETSEGSSGDDDSDDEDASSDWDGADGSDWDDSDDEGDSDDDDSEDGSDTDADVSQDADGDSTETFEESSDTDADGSSDSAGDDSPAKELERILNESLDSVLERLDDKLANDIRLYNGDALMEGEMIPEPPCFPSQESLPVSAEAVKASEEFGYELKRLRAQHDPAWNRRVAQGRINPARWEAGCDIEEAFDRFEMGRNDVTDIEAVILLDVSGSMSSFEKTAHESMWAIKNALDEVGSNTSVVAYTDFYDTYNTSCFTLYSKDERVTQEMRFIPNLGGTNPLKALQYAQGLLANSNRAIKLLFIVTDGEWESKCLEETEKIIYNLRDGGVITSLAWLSSWDIDLHRKNTHGAEIVSHVTQASDLFNLGRSIVEVGIDRQLTR